MGCRSSGMGVYLARRAEELFLGLPRPPVGAARPLSSAASSAVMPAVPSPASTPSPSPAPSASSAGSPSSPGLPGPGLLRAVLAPSLPSGLGLGLGLGLPGVGEGDSGGEVDSGSGMGIVRTCGCRLGGSSAIGMSGAAASAAAAGSSGSAFSPFFFLPFLPFPLPPLALASFFAGFLAAASGLSRSGKSAGPRACKRTPSSESNPRRHPPPPPLQRQDAPGAQARRR